MQKVESLEKFFALDGDHSFSRISRFSVSMIAQENNMTPIVNSSIQVSRAAAQLDSGLQAWRECPLDETPYVLLDVRYEHIREGGQIVDCAALLHVRFHSAQNESRSNA